MGKVTRTRHQVRYNPLCKDLRKPLQKKGKSPEVEMPAVVNNFAENLVVSKGTKGLSIACKKVADPSDEEKIVGLNMLAAFSLVKENAELMVQEEVPDKLSSLMLHQNSQIQLAATGTLCNLSDAIPDVMIEDLVAQKVMKNLCLLLKTYSKLSKPPENIASKYTKGIAVPLEETDQTISILIYAMDLLSRMCECNSDVLALANAAGIVQILMKFIDSKTWGYTLSIEVASCLLCLTEDNSAAYGVVIPHADLLVDLVKKHQTSYAGLHFCSLLSGILVNLQYCSPSSAALHEIAAVLSSSLQIDLDKLFRACTINYNLSDFNSGLSAQMLSLEVLANWCYGDEDFGSCDISDVEDEMDVEYSTVNSVDPSGDLADEFVQAMKSHRFAIKTLKIVNQLTLSTFDLKKLRETDVENIKTRIDMLRTRSLQCFHNLIGPSNIDDFGSSDDLLAAWNVLLHQLSKPLQDEQKEAATDAMRAIMEKMCKENSSSLCQIGEEQLQVMLEISSSAILPVKANFIRMLGTLGCHLVKTKSEENLLIDPLKSVLAAITNFMLKTVETASEIWIAAEAFDVLIDLYSDDKTDTLARDLRLVHFLSILQDPFKAKYNKRKRRKKLGEHRALVTTVADNLQSFIDYKKKRVSSGEQI